MSLPRRGSSGTGSTPRVRRNQPPGAGPPSARRGPSSGPRRRGGRPARPASRPAPRPGNPAGLRRGGWSFPYEKPIRDHRQFGPEKGPESGRCGKELQKVLRASSYAPIWWANVTSRSTVESTSRCPDSTCHPFGGIEDDPTAEGGHPAAEDPARGGDIAVRQHPRRTGERLRRLPGSSTSRARRTRPPGQLAGQPAASQSSAMSLPSTRSVFFGSRSPCEGTCATTCEADVSLASCASIGAARHAGARRRVVTSRADRRGRTSRSRPTDRRPTRAANGRTRHGCWRAGCRPSGRLVAVPVRSHRPRRARAPTCRRPVPDTCRGPLHRTRARHAPGSRCALDDVGALDVGVEVVSLGVHAHDLQGETALGGLQPEEIVRETTVRLGCSHECHRGRTRPLLRSGTLQSDITSRATHAQPPRPTVDPAGRVEA